MRKLQGMYCIVLYCIVTTIHLNGVVERLKKSRNVFCLNFDVLLYGLSEHCGQMTALLNSRSSKKAV